MFPADEGDYDSQVEYEDDTGETQDIYYTPMKTIPMTDNGLYTNNQQQNVNSLDEVSQVACCLVTGC